MERNPSRQLEGAVLALAMIFPTLLTFVYFVLLADRSGGAQQSAYAVGKTLQFALPVFWIGVVCRERWLVRRFSKRGALEGGLFGLLVFWGMIFGCVLWFTAPGGPLGPDSSASRAVAAKIHGLGLNWYSLSLVGVFYSIVHSGLEEYYWRWFVFGRLQRFMTWPVAAVVSSLGFMAHHVLLLGTYFGYNSVYCWLGSTAVAVGGLYWCWLYRRSDSIWGPWLGHGLVDAAIFGIGLHIVAVNFGV